MSWIAKHSDQPLKRPNVSGRSRFTCSHVYPSKPFSVPLAFSADFDTHWFNMANLLMSVGEARVGRRADGTRSYYSDYSKL